MDASRRATLCRAGTAAAMLSGVLIMVLSFVWPTVSAVHAPDAILTPEELRDPRMIEVVHQAMGLRSSSRSLLPIAALGSAVVVGSSLALLSSSPRNPADADHL